jgi:hypothetical protein
MNEYTGMRSQTLHLDFWPDYCKRVFGHDLPKNTADKTNQHYGGLDIRGTNIFFANAEEDPWQWAGMRELKDDFRQKGMDAEMINCEDCAHCVDFHTPTDHQPQALTDVQEKIADTVARWIDEAKATRAVQAKYYMQ